MKKILLFLLLFLININFVNAGQIKFSDCVDGDTFKAIINDEEEVIRLLAIDTPESVHPTKKTEYYGNESSEWVCETLKNANTIILEYDNNSDERDKYNRILAWVFVDGELLQEKIVSLGYGKVAYLYGDYKWTKLLQEREIEAKKLNIGIWNNESKNEYDDVEITCLDVIIMLLIIIFGIISKPFIKKIKRKFKKINYVK